MIVANMFLAMFAAQILALSVVFPGRFIRYCLTLATSMPVDRLTQAHQAIDFDLAQARFFARYRALNTGVAFLGVLLLCWLAGYMRSPTWDEGRVSALTTAYFLLQVSPLLFAAWFGIRRNKALKRALLETKRKAVLQRRGLFDFVSPITVAVAVLAYVLFAAFVMYLRQNPFPGFAGFVNIVCVTLVYAVYAATAYMMLYGTKPKPLETNLRREYTIGLVVRACVYSCIVCVVSLSISFALELQDLEHWQPFAQSLFLVMTMLLVSRGIAAPPRKPGGKEVDPDRPLPPGIPKLTA
jgi:hypothetical protein